MYSVSSIWRVQNGFGMPQYNHLLLISAHRLINVPYDDTHRDKGRLVHIAQGGCHENSSRVFRLCHVVANRLQSVGARLQYNLHLGKTGARCVNSSYCAVLTSHETLYPMPHHCWMPHIVDKVATPIIATRLPLLIVPSHPIPMADHMSWHGAR